MRRKRGWRRSGWMLAGLGMTLWLGPALARDAALSVPQQARYQTLVNELRCLVCQNQTIADSNAPLAQDLRAQVRTRLLAGESDAEIRRYLTDRYGEFVLYKPPFTLRNAALWLAPGMLLLLGLAIVVWQRRGRRAELPAPDADALRRLLDEESRR